MLLHPIRNEEGEMNHGRTATDHLQHVWGVGCSYAQAPRVVTARRFSQQQQVQHEKNTKVKWHALTATASKRNICTYAPSL